MRKSAYLGLAAAIAVAAAAVSCGEPSAELSAGGDDGASGTYTIKIADNIENGVISANRSAGNKGQIVTISASPAAASAWEGAEGEAPEIESELVLGGGGGDNPQYPWYLNNLSITGGGKTVSYTKAAANVWTFKMPANNVVITATFSQTPVKSNELAILDVNASATVVPKLASGQYNYTADIPRIIQTAGENTETEEDENPSSIDPDIDPEADSGASVQTFRIIAVPEDPQAEVTVSPPADDSGEYELVEGKTEYKITVAREGLATTTYTFSASYWPDLSLSSITLSSEGHDDWTHSIPLQDEQEHTAPYSKIGISASANNPDIELSASKTSGAGDINGNTPDWTLVFPESAVQLSSAVKIKSSKTVGGTLYEKAYILNFVKPVFSDNKYPTTFWADGGGVSIVQDAETKKYYEVHTFTSSGTLDFKVDIKDSGLTARVLVVGGGGGSGSGNSPSYGSGAGGMVENGAYPLTQNSYTVVVGLGGAGGPWNSVKSGVDGGDSKFGDDIIAYGGGSGSRRYGNTAYEGNSGGSSGGGTTSPEVKPGIGGTSYGNIGGTGISAGDDAGGGGGAGGPGKFGHVPGKDFGGPGRSSDITGSPVIYAAGGDVAANGQVFGGYTGDANTGNGGGGGWNYSGGAGGSGIVVARFPARPNPAE
jgi:hypothetical protein